LELPEKFDISPTFNVFDMYEFHDGETCDDEGTIDGWEQKLPIKQAEEVEENFSTRIGRKNHNKEYLEYSIKWESRGSEVELWVSKEELICLQNSSYYGEITT
jgi:hypothetical protein